MDLNELKSTWCKVSKQDNGEDTLALENIDRLLQKRGNGILSRLNRNVRIGFWLLGLFLIFTLFDQYFPAEKLLPNEMEQMIVVPLWIKMLGLIVNLTVMLSFLLFVFRYHRLNIRSLAALDMATALKRVLGLLDTFKKEFYLALGVFLSAMVTSFLFGAWTGFHMASAATGSSVKATFLAFVLVAGILVLVVGGLFYIFHKGFNSLYGQYRIQLTEALKELNESEE